MIKGKPEMTKLQNKWMKATVLAESSILYSFSSSSIHSSDVYEHSQVGVTLFPS